MQDGKREDRASGYAISMTTTSITATDAGNRSLSKAVLLLVGCWHYRLQKPLRRLLAGRAARLSAGKEGWAPARSGISRRTG